MLQPLKFLSSFRLLLEQKLVIADSRSSKGAISDDEGEYEAITDEIHRRPAYPVRAPALLRHVSMRFCPDAETSSSELHRKTRGEAIEHINKYLSYIRHDELPSADIGEGRYSRLVTVGVDTRIRCRVRVELHREYLSVTYVCDQFSPLEDSGGQHDPIGRASNILNQLRNERTDEATNKDNVDFLYEDFWEMLEGKLSTAMLRGIAPFFADFRSVAIVPAKSAKVALSANERFMPDRDTQTYRKAREIDPSLTNFMTSQQDFVSCVLGIKRASGDERPNQEANVVLCGMLDGAAIYCSGLGGKIAGQRAPLRYLVVYNGQTTRQLGRFIRRLHVLGELRLAALLDLRSLNNASGALVQLGRRVDRLAQSINARDPSGSDTLVSLHKDLTALNQTCVGGLVYRVNQSRHYARAFEERIQDMRIVRVEGWQAYDAFVRRNLFKTFDWISRVLDRYNQFNLRLERLGALLQTRAMQQNTQNVFEQTQATNKQTAELVHLQYFAETAGAVVFVKYAGELLNKLGIPFVQAMMNPSRNSGAQWLVEKVSSLNSVQAAHHDAPPLAYVAALFAYIALRTGWFGMSFLLHEKVDRRLLRVAALLGASMAASIFLWVLAILLAATEPNAL